jgi:hypothetical protein
MSLLFFFTRELYLSYLIGKDTSICFPNEISLNFLLITPYTKAIPPGDLRQYGRN